MMYDNAANQQAGAGLASRSVTSPQPSRPLDSIGNAADRAFQLCNRIEGFLTRFHGPGPESANGDATVSIGYANELSRLHGNLDRADRLIDNLETIG